MSLFTLFSFADAIDFFLLFLGVLSAIAHGAALPVFFLYFGNLVNGFGAYQNDTSKMVAVVSQVIHIYIHTYIYDCVCKSLYMYTYVFVCLYV